MKDTLQAARYAGQDAERGASNPFAPGTPEYDAWLFGYSEVHQAPRTITSLLIGALARVTLQMPLRLVANWHQSRPIRTAAD
jgi:hypothetical protein